MSIFSDINLRIDQVDNTDSIAIYDTNVVKQSLIALVSTEVNEIWNMRPFGLNLKQFMHYPLIDVTAFEIETYITGKIAKFETSVTYLDYASQAIFDYNSNSIHFNLAYKINLTGEIIVLPTITASLS